MLIILLKVKNKIVGRIRLFSGAWQDSVLDQLAQDKADDLATARHEKLARQRYLRLAPKLARKYRKIKSAILATKATNGNELRFDPKSVFDSSISHYGIGIAQGTHSELGEETIFLVFFLASSK